MALLYTSPTATRVPSLEMAVEKPDMGSVFSWPQPVNETVSSR
jgi:hypothetical protein